MFPDDLIEKTRDFIDQARRNHVTVATAESCTGGMIAGCLTEVPGASAVLERGFIVYSNAAKHELLGVPEALINEHGAVSEPVARALAEGVLEKSPATLSVAVTGIAGPDGGSKLKPVGLVHIAAARRGQPTLHEKHLFGNIGRANIRLATIRAALKLMTSLI